MPPPPLPQQKALNLQFSVKTLILTEALWVSPEVVAGAVEPALRATPLYDWVQSFE